MAQDDQHDRPFQARSADLGAPPGSSVAPPAAQIMDFCGAISSEEAAQMIREIEEAFEHPDAG